MFEAIEIGPFILWTHALFLILGTYLAAEFFLRLAQSANLPLTHFQEHAWWYLLAFLLGGRLAAILAEYHVYLHDPLRTVMFWDGGFHLLGGAIGVGVLLAAVTWQSRATLLQWLDVLLPATSLGLVFDWLGKFAAGQAYGKPTDMPWGMTYDAMHVRYTVPVHPVQLYYMFFFLLLTFFLLVVRKIARRAGAETLVGIILASCATIALEPFRGDFGVPVFVTTVDMLMLLLLFLSLGILTIPAVRVFPRMLQFTWGFLVLLFLGYIVLRFTLPLARMEFRSTQFLAIVALLVTIVYVVFHRRRYPHL